MSQDTKFVVRCRAIILDKDRLLVVKHSPKSTFVVLPGGHLEYGEDIFSCMKREIVEELGIEPIIGRLLYVNNFVDGKFCHSVEFFFEIKNSSDFIDCVKLVRTHAHELAEIIWINKDDNFEIRPQSIQSDFKNGNLSSDNIKFISSNR